MGRSLRQEAPQAFAQAVVDVDHFRSEAGKPVAARNSSRVARRRRFPTRNESNGGRAVEPRQALIALCDANVVDTNVQYLRFPVRRINTRAIGWFGRVSSGGDDKFGQVADPAGNARPIRVPHKLATADQLEREIEMPANLAAAAAVTVILVHGAFADGSSWNKVIANLQKKSVDVVAVQNPLSSLADDVAATQRAIDAAKGPVILVGHSWAGAVITQAGGDPKVKALVYINAFAPDVGMSVNDLGKGAALLPWQKTIIASKDGFIWIPPESVAANFAQDLPKSQAMMIGRLRDQRKAAHSTTNSLLPPGMTSRVGTSYRGTIA